MLRQLVCVIYVATLLASCGQAVDKDEPVVINNGGANNGASNNGASNNGGQNNGGLNNGGANNGPALTGRAADVAIGVQAPGTARELGEFALQVGAEAVFAASIQANGGQQLVTTGTLTQQGNAFSYTADPNDRLRIAWSSGPPTDFFIMAFDGDFSGDATRFVNGDHVVQLRMLSEGNADLSLNSQRQGGQSAASLGGSIVLDGVSYQVDLQQGGTYSSSVDISWAEHTSEDAFQGTIQGDDGFSAQIQEAYNFKLVQGDNGVTNETRQANNTWTVNGNEYAVQGLTIRFETLNGWANPSDYWIVEGQILENGAVIGQVTYEQTTAWISIYVPVDGENIELQRFLLPQ